MGRKSYYITIECCNKAFIYTNIKHYNKIKFPDLFYFYCIFFYAILFFVLKINVNIFNIFSCRS